jgi:hypothetical protein
LFRVLIHQFWKNSEIAAARSAADDAKATMDEVKKESADAQDGASNA